MESSVISLGFDATCYYGSQTEQIYTWVMDRVLKIATNL